MNFLIDAQLPPGLSLLVASCGHCAEHVSDAVGLEAKDETIWKYAKQTGYAIITKDEDFAIKACMETNGPPVVWIRIGNTSNRYLLSWFAPLLPKVINALTRGERLVELT